MTSLSICVLQLHNTQRTVRGRSLDQNHHISLARAFGFQLCDWLEKEPQLPHTSMLGFWLCDWGSKCMCVHVSVCVFCLLFCLFSSSISCLFALFSLSRCMLCTPLFSSLSLATDPVCLPPPNSLSRLFWQNLLFPDLLRALSLCITFFLFLWHKVAF